MVDAPLSDSETLLAPRYTDDRKLLDCGKILSAGWAEACFILFFLTAVHHGCAEAYFCVIHNIIQY